MKLTAIHHTKNCDNASCPTIYLNEAGNYVFQGFKIKDTVKSKYDVPEGEDLLEFPKEFIESFFVKK